MNCEKGQSLVELLIAMGIFALAVSTITWLIIDVYLADRAGRERMEATFLAQEGLEAVRSMRDSDFDSLNVGMFGLALAGNKWIFSGSSDTYKQFTRQIVISEVVGDIDQTDVKKIKSQVTWQITPLRPVSVILTDYLTDWEQTQGEAGQLDVNIDEAKIGGRGKDLKETTIENISESDITIDKITTWWDNSNLIEKITIADNDVWSKDGPGSPIGEQPSGTELDIEDFVVEAGEGQIKINKFKFDDSMIGATFIILFRMIDGSTKYVLVIPGVASPCGPQADTLMIDISGAEIGGGGNRELQGITIENIDANCAIIIDKITATWDNGNFIREIKIDSIKVWSRTGPGTPTGKQPSGTELDIQDFILPVSSGQLDIDKFRFDGSMSGATFDIIFTMSDGSTKSTGNFSPPD